MNIFEYSRIMIVGNNGSGKSYLEDYIIIDPEGNINELQSWRQTKNLNSI